MDATAERYRRFAEVEARERSPLYAGFAGRLAEDAECLGFLDGLPMAKRQPNLLFAAVRFVAGLAHDWPDFRRRLFDHLEEIREVMLTRSTQTNEPARCATLLPLLARLPGPLALLEVGASAGLCLLPDRYAYDYGGVSVGTGNPRFACDADAATPIPARVPQIVWRAGLDLNPLDVSDPDDAAWLEALVWPGNPRRLENLRAALAAAQSQPPLVVRGDLRRDLAALAAEAPKDATLVIFHTAVLMYVASREEREAFAQEAMALGRWVSNEAAGVMPGIEAGESPEGDLLLALDGRPVAWADPHGSRLRWIA